MTPSASTHIVAVTTDEGVWCDQQRRLPRVTADWPELNDLVPARSDLIPLAPGQRVGDATLHVLLARDPGPPRPELSQLLPLAEIDDDPALIRAVEGALDHWRALDPGSAREPWFAADYLPAVTEWLTAALGRRGRAAPLRPRVVRAWTLSCLLRYPLADGSRAVMVKGSARHFAHEPALTRWVQRLAPRHAPEVIDIDQHRRLLAMELFDEPSPPQDATGQPDAGHALAVEAAAAMAEIQLASLDHATHIHAAGAPDRTLEATLDALHEVLTDGAELGLLSRSERTELAALEPACARRMSELFAGGLPTTLIHGDLHPGNLARGSDGAPLIFDWSDAAWSHPALDAAHLAGYFAQAPHTAEAVWGAWGRRWSQARPGVDPARLREAAETADRLYQLITYEGIARHTEPGSGLGGIQARLLRGLLRDPAALG